MKILDKQILEWYLKGYEDESFGTSSTVSENPLLNNAYSLGASHVLPNRKYNVLEDSEVLKIIKS